ncbi:NAD(P)H-dependent flavin oxidoreductase [Fictibacillus aquaticus]|uniref:Probable nitronate monooxygenase n=1 Tax=Fictibacillus aquaticus TaxID=2021314 RepID=A0A235FDK4_9BACL|nr:nitronate monooxygenase [Fictibacillus aquaticus]OYD58997.1 2-nitropropane dioxygenase [Fictibacillus aquaticus]
MRIVTKVTEGLGIQVPVIQGGLAYLAYSRLAAAVSNAGGLGQITAMSLPDEEALRSEIREVHKLTEKPFGVNFAIGQHGRQYEHMLETAVEEGVKIVSVTGGNPAPFLKRLEGTGVKTLVLVASVRQAQKAEECGADFVMAVGQEGGGHIGRDDIGTVVLIPRVVEAVSIPVIASGGIVDGKGLAAALALGAEGIEMGTRFIAAAECEHAHPAYKQAIIDASEQDTVVIKRSLGAPGRAVYTPFTEKILELERNQAGFDVLKDYISGETNKKYIYEGLGEEGFGWAGQGAGGINAVQKAEEILKTIEKEAASIMDKLHERLQR